MEMRANIRRALAMAMVLMTLFTALPQLQPPAFAAKSSVLTTGSSGAAVKKLQNRLKELGYFSGKANGKYGSSTKSAVKAFQTANSLTVSGKAGKTTQQKLYSKKAVSKASYDKIKPLKPGSKGAQVKKVQKQLKNLGYYKGAIDGKYGTGLKNAVKTFQRANGLKATGTANSATRKLLNGGKGKSYKKYKSEQAVKSLKYGDKGEQVKRVQTQLKKLGYFSGSANGRFGGSTRSAVKAFQTANHLSVSGTANTATRKLLNSGKGISKKTYLSRKKKVEKAISLAKTKLGKRYVLGDSGPNTFDCSGFTSYVFTKAGIRLDGNAKGQGYGASKRLKRSQLKRGDLVFFDTVKDNDPCDHVGIYLGSGKFIHASSTQRKVVISSISGVYADTFSWGRRLI
jgi:peptidoglycan hydrolase-like protein with peptidoglycan-binding domain